MSCIPCTQYIAARLYTKCKHKLVKMQLIEIKCRNDSYAHVTNGDALLSCYFPSLNYCYGSYHSLSPTIVQDLNTNCNVQYLSYSSHFCSLSLNSTHNHNLQQLHIYSLQTDVPDSFTTSVSAHGGLVHVCSYEIVRS